MPRDPYSVIADGYCEAVDAMLDAGMPLGDPMIQDWLATLSSYALRPNLEPDAKKRIDLLMLRVNPLAPSD